MTFLKRLADIDSEKVLHSLGYSDTHKLPARIVSLVNGYIENACDIIEPACSYTIRDVDWVQGSVVSIQGSGIFFESKTIGGLLEQCEKAALFIVTIGSRLEEIVSQLARDRLILQARVLDAIGSVAVESMADYAKDMVRKVASTMGLYISWRFSPGHCDWDISQQSVLFQTMNGDNAGVQLTEQCLMIPQKSVSGIIGIGHSDIESYNPCKTCDKHDCKGRR
jgi:hypothetical protein